MNDAELDVVAGHGHLLSGIVGILEQQKGLLIQQREEIDTLKSELASTRYALYGIIALEVVNINRRAGMKPVTDNNDEVKEKFKEYDKIYEYSLIDHNTNNDKTPPTQNKLVKFPKLVLSEVADV